MKIYYGLLACLAILFAIILVCGMEWVYIMGLAAFSAAAILIISLTVLVRRKNGRENIEPKLGLIYYLLYYF